MKKFYIYECHSAMCRGEEYVATKQPLSCPYCGSEAIYKKPKFVITKMNYDLYREESR